MELDCSLYTDCPLVLKTGSPWLGGYHQSHFGMQTHGRESYLKALAFLCKESEVRTKTKQNLLGRDSSGKHCEVGGTVTGHLQYFSGAGKGLFSQTEG